MKKSHIFLGIALSILLLVFALSLAGISSSIRKISINSKNTKNCVFVKTNNITLSAEKTIYARIKVDTILYKTNDITNNTLENQYFLLPQSYFVRIISSSSESDTTKVEYSGFIGYIESSRIQQIDWTPQTPYQIIEAKINSEYGAYISSFPKTSSVGKRLLFAGTTNIKVLGKIKAEAPIDGTSDVWYFCLYEEGPTTPIVGYIFGERIDLISAITPNTETNPNENVASASTDNILISDDNSTATNELELSKEVKIILVIVFSIPTIGIFMLLLKKPKNREKEDINGNKTDIKQTIIDNLHTKTDNNSTSINNLRTKSDKIQTGFDKNKIIIDEISTDIDKNSTKKFRFNPYYEENKKKLEENPTFFDKNHTKKDTINTKNGQLQDNNFTIYDNTSTILDKNSTVSDNRRNKTDNYSTTFDRKHTKTDNYSTVSDNRRNKTDNYNTTFDRKHTKTDNYSTVSDNRRNKTDNYSTTFDNIRNKNDNYDTVSDNNGIKIEENQTNTATFPAIIKTFFETGEEKQPPQVKKKRKFFERFFDSPPTTHKISFPDDDEPL